MSKTTLQTALLIEGFYCLHIALPQFEGTLPMKRLAGRDVIKLPPLEEIKTATKPQFKDRIYQH